MLKAIVIVGSGWAEGRVDGACLLYSGIVWKLDESDYVNTQMLMKFVGGLWLEDYYIKRRTQIIFSPFFGVEVFHDLVSNWNYGQSTYPHVRYTHEKLSLNKTILREQQRLITPCNTQRHFSLSVTSHIDVVFRFQPWHCVCEGFPGWEAPQVEIKR